MWPMLKRSAVALLTTLTMLSGCVSGPTETNLCLVFGDDLPIKMSRWDTKGTKDQIVRVNGIYWDHCE
jgi:hypothetical protein